MRHKTDLIKYEIYSYVNHLTNLFLNALPPFTRTFFYKILFQQFGKGSSIDYGCYFRYFNKISIGSNVEINRGFKVFPSYKIKDAQVIISDNVKIAPEVTVFGAGQSSKNLEDVASTVVIGKNSYIGGGTIIRYGTTIGQDSVIAAGSVVFRDIPGNMTHIEKRESRLYPRE